MKYTCRVCTVSISRLTEWLKALRSEVKHILCGQLGEACVGARWELGEACVEASAVEPAMWWKGAAGGDEPAFRGRHKARKLGRAESAESGLCGPRSVASALSCVVARWERTVGQAMGLGREKGLGPELGRDTLHLWSFIKLASLVGKIA